jgi:hypothetical protein
MKELQDCKVFRVQQVQPELRVFKGQPVHKAQPVSMAQMLMMELQVPRVLQVPREQPEITEQQARKAIRV